MQFANFTCIFLTIFQFILGPAEIIQKPNDKRQTTGKVWSIVLGQAQITGPLPPPAVVAVEVSVAVAVVADGKMQQ